MIQGLEIDAADSGFFVVRTPLLPLAELLAQADGLQSHRAGDATLEEDRKALRERLGALVARPEILEALFLASPRLIDALEAWRLEPESRRGLSTERALVRYLQRMTTRPTPFGLFSGYAVGEIGNETRLKLPSLASIRRSTRIDSGYLFGLVEWLEKDPAIHGQIRFHPNPTRYRAAGRLHYVVRSSEDGAHAHRLVAVDETDYLLVTLEQAKGGATVQELADGLVGPGVPPDEARAYVELLIRERMLVSELEPPVTGPAPLTFLIEHLERLPAARTACRVLRDVAGRLADIDRGGLGVPPGRYIEIEERLRPLVRGEPPQSVFQVDMTKRAPSLMLGREVVAELLRAVERLRLLAAPHRDPLAELRRAFRTRYEDREVPLLEAFDDEAGVGLDLLPPPREMGAARAAAVADLQDASHAASHGPRDRLLLDKLLQACGDRAATIELSDDELRSIASEPPVAMPPAFAVAATLVAATSAPRADEFELVVYGAFGPSGARMLGRFCGADEELRAYVERHLREEEAQEPDAVFAEVAHLPQARLGNVIHRPLLRDFEIDYLGPSGAPAERRIPLSDLRIAVSGDAFVLSSVRLDRRVIPRVSSAVSLHLNVPPVFRLLGLLQNQRGPDGISFDWGVLRSAAYLPRVQAGRSWLALARWLVRREEIVRLCSGSDGFREVQRWRAERGVPRLARLGSEGTSVTVDFDNVLSVESFLKLLAGRTVAVLTELYPPPDQLCLRGSEGGYVHELHVPFVLRTEVASRAQRRPPARVPTVKRTFAPGSEWLYVKLYGGRAAGDALLREEVGPLCEELSARGQIDRWFFVRYGDPDAHLRLRVGGESGTLHAAVLPAVERVAAEALESGRLWRIQLDTYEREVERYGGPHGIDLVEGIFHADSVAVARALRTLPPSDDRLPLAIVGVDGQFEGLGLALTERAHAVARLRAELADGATAGELSETELSKEFRRRRAHLPNPDGTGLPEDLVEPFRDRLDAMRPLAHELRCRERDGLLSVPVAVLAESIAHLHVNRVFRDIAPLEELRVYDFLARIYRAQAALGGRPLHAKASTGDVTLRPAKRV